MRDLTFDELTSLQAGGERLWTACGAATGIAVGATIYFGVVGLALTINKALAACAIATFYR